MALSTDLVTKDRTVCPVLLVIVVFVLLGCLNFDPVIDFPRIVREFHEDWTTPNLPISPKELEPANPKPPSKGGELTTPKHSPKGGEPRHPKSSPKESRGGEILEKLKELSRLASDGHDYALSSAERDAWHTQFPCQSRSDLPAVYAARKHVKDISSNSEWERVLKEYSNLHRICMKRVGNVTEHFLNKANNVSIPGCKFLVGEGTNGLGNKLLVTVSAVLYAIATQRILLMPPRTNLQPVLCEPFVGSSWMLETDDLAPWGFGNSDTSWVEENVFIGNMHGRLELLKLQEKENHTQTASSAFFSPVVDAVVVSSGWGQWQPRDWFYCSTEQKFLAEVPWVYMSGCLYSLPKIFGSPFFRTSLKALFPDNMVTTRLLRSILLPSDPVWIRFRHINHAYFQQPDRRVAVQLRFFGDTHETMGSLVINRVLDCVLKNGILPNVSVSIPANSIEAGRKRPSWAAPITTVFIASLYPDLHDLLSDFYLRNPTTESGEDVNLVQVTKHWFQSVGVEEDTEALVEALLLSVSDVLLVTPMSTFGGLAHTYAGITPWFINTFNGSSTEPCERGQSVDDCQIGVTENYYCPNDPEIANPALNGEDVAEQGPPILGLCRLFDFVAGSQVLTDGSPK